MHLHWTSTPAYVSRIFPLPACSPTRRPVPCPSNPCAVTYLQMENPDHDGNSITNKGVKANSNAAPAPVLNNNNQSQQSMSDTARPPSARSNRDERLKLLKEKQNEERLKKLEELKEHALIAARLREEQDSRRKKHFEQLGKREDERRKQAEERRRILDEERKLSLQTKFETKKATPPKLNDKKPLFAFGSCTPRLIENNVDGFHWKSQYNLNVTRESTLKSTSAHDLHSQTKMSASMYDWNQQRSTFDLCAPPQTAPLTRFRSARPTQLEPDRVFCGRRKTDLTPTMPIRRSDGSSTRSTSRAGGSGSVTPSVMTSSMVSSLMTSSTHSQAPSLRPRRLGPRKARPVSVHITGISNGNGLDLSTSNASTPPGRGDKSTTGVAHSPHTPKDKDKPLVKPTSASAAAKTGRNPNTNSNGEISTPTSRPPNRKSEEKPPIQEKENRKSESRGAASAAGKSPGDTGTIRRAKPAAGKSTPKVEPKENGGNVVTKVVKPEKPTVVAVASEAESVTSTELEPPVIKNPETAVTKQQEIGVSVEKVELTTAVAEPIVMEENEKAGDLNLINVIAAAENEVDIKPKTAESDLMQAGNATMTEIETPALVTAVEIVPAAVVEEKELSQEEIQPVIGASGDNADARSPNPKILTEEAARAALADKRRLAREVQERELARLEEERLLEEERQRLEMEEAERLATEARQHEEDRLRIAIEEQEKREMEEKKKLLEEEIARQERETYEREAAREAERIRLEMEERLKREEEERLERKRRVEAIMSRTRKKEAESAAMGMATTPTPPEETSTNGVGGVEPITLNGIQTSHVDQSSTPAQTTLVNLNNFNNNNDFSAETLIDFGDLIQSHPTSSSQPPSNPPINNELINSSLQDLLS